MDPSNLGTNRASEIGKPSNRLHFWNVRVAAHRSRSLLMAETEAPRAGYTPRRGVQRGGNRPRAMGFPPSRRCAWEHQLCCNALAGDADRQTRRARACVRREPEPRP